MAVRVQGVFVEGRLQAFEGDAEVCWGGVASSVGRVEWGMSF